MPPNLGVPGRALANPAQAVSHYGEALKAIVNEKFGDGIMSGAGRLPRLSSACTAPASSFFIPAQCQLACLAILIFHHLPHSSMQPPVSSSSHWYQAALTSNVI